MYGDKYLHPKYQGRRERVTAKLYNLASSSSLPLGNDRKIEADRIITTNYNFYISDLITGNIYNCYFNVDKNQIVYYTQYNIEKMGVGITSLDVATQDYIYFFIQSKSGLKLYRCNSYYYESMRELQEWFDFNAYTTPLNLPFDLDIKEIINVFVNKHDYLYVITEKRICCFDLKQRKVVFINTIFPSPVISIIDAGIDVYRNEIYLVYKYQQDYNYHTRGETYVSICNDKLEELYEVEYWNTPFVVNNGVIFGVSGNKITIYQTINDKGKNKSEGENKNVTLTMLESHVIDDYPDNVESVFSVTGVESGVLLVAGYDQDKFYTLNRKY